jgi:hypothetical protein
MVRFVLGFVGKRAEAEVLRRCDLKTVSLKHQIIPRALATVSM